MPGCDTKVHVEGFTVIVNGSVFGTVDTSLANRCPHKNCLVCTGCAKKALKKGDDICPACQGAAPLADRKSAVEGAEAMITSMLKLYGTNASAAGGKRAREAEDEMEEVELEEDDFDEDMLALDEITQETVHEVVVTFPVNLTEPEKFWKIQEGGFYENLRRLYQGDRQATGDRYSLIFQVARGWTRTLPLHILIGEKYLLKILALDPMSFYFFVENESAEADFAIRSIKFTFCGDQACQSARAIREEKNNALKHANPTGQIAKAITMRLPDGTPMRVAGGKLRKEFIKVPFLIFGPGCIKKT
mmetsp:Transcript_84336/g.136712  ORF Transcript_84336/g.136712 Transcript_84336/m.136712 type:complete len:303 (-) Transcript_84336:326-1234(-)